MNLRYRKKNKLAVCQTLAVLLWLLDLDMALTYCKCLQPYHVEYTSSRLITVVKQHWAELVLGWVTAWEYSVL